MLKLTDEQCEALSRRYSEGWVSRGTYRAEVEALLTAYHALLAASPTHRVVEAPEGFEIAKDNLVITETDGFEFPKIQVFIQPIPKPCPAPVLEPVTVTVESVYGKRPNIPNGWEAKFGLAEDLDAQGYTDFIGFDNGAIRPMQATMPGKAVIGLRKWEGK